MKRLLSMMMVITMVTSLAIFDSNAVSSMTDFAELGNEEGFINGELVVAEEDDPMFVNGDNGEPSPEAIDVAALGGLDAIMPLTRFSVPDSAELPVPVCKQEERYYCGPATAQQLIRLFGKDYTTTQDQIARDMGTTSIGSSLSQIVRYVENSGYAVYRILKNLSIEEMHRLIGANISSYYTPPIGRLKFWKVGNWPYETSGHFLNISGYDYTNHSDAIEECEIRLTDPNIQRVQPNSSGSYYVTLGEFHQATMDHTQKEFGCC